MLLPFYVHCNLVFTIVAGSFSELSTSNITKHNIIVAITVNGTHARNHQHLPGTISTCQSKVNALEWLLE